MVTFTGWRTRPLNLYSPFPETRHLACFLPLVTASRVRLARISSWQQTFLQPLALLKSRLKMASWCAPKMIEQHAWLPCLAILAALHLVSLSTAWLYAGCTNLLLCMKKRNVLLMYCRSWCAFFLHAEAGLHAGWGSFSSYWPPETVMLLSIHQDTRI